MVKLPGPGPGDRRLEAAEGTSLEELWATIEGRVPEPVLDALGALERER